MRRPIAVPLIDPYDRRVKDLRISITDRCNFRCTYCMPEEGMQWLERDALLTYEEQARIARVCVERFGFESIRITGGEPTVRAHLPRLFRLLAPLGVRSRHDHERRPAPRAGPRRSSTPVSGGSTSRSTHCAATRSSASPGATSSTGSWPGSTRRSKPGSNPVKINAVVIRGVNDEEVVDLAAFGRDRGVGVRFIEFMPLDATGEWTMDQVVPAREILDRIDAVFPLEREHVPGSGHIEPAERFRYADGGGDVGVIASVTEPFCGNCDRVRITAEGKFRTCLFSIDELDLRAVVRGGGSDDDVADVVAARGRSEVGRPPHRPGRLRPSRALDEPDRRLTPHFYGENRGTAVAVVAIGMALAYAVTNGLHDAANSIAVLVATRAARPGQAIFLAAAGNVLGPLLLGAAVADTIAGIVTVDRGQAIAVIGAGLTGAVVWNVFTWIARPSLELGSRARSAGSSAPRCWTRGPTRSAGAVSTG